MKIRTLFLAVLALSFCNSISAQKWVNTKHVVPDSIFDSLAPTPPMGWNSWNYFKRDINEDLVKEIADAFVTSGMKDAGYEYIVLDDYWQIDRDEDGNIIADPEKFPHGMKALADYIHSKGLKFGLYSCAGTNTCAGCPGSRGYEFQDALQYARWDVDFLKYDWCNNDGQDAPSSYRRMRDALKNSGRPILFNLCEWGSNKPWTWAKGVGHMWRVSGDIIDSFDGNIDWGGLSVLSIIDIMAPLSNYAGPGHWNDADMLEVGNGGMTDTEYTTHFSMWCMFSAPLFAGNDVRNMTPTIKNILTNKEAIAINQDALGKQAIRFMDYGDYEIWTKPLANGDVAVCFLNRARTPWDLNYDWKQMNKIDQSKTYNIRDLWQHKNIGTTAHNVTMQIPAHGVLMVRLSSK